MPRAIFLLGLLSLCAASAFAAADSLQLNAARSGPGPQEEGGGLSPVRLNLPVDAAITLPATAWTLYAFPKIYSKPNIDSATLAGLSKNNIPAFDRWAVRHSDKADELSNYAFYGSVPYPFVLLADRAIRKDWARVYGLYWEAMAITGLLYTAGDYFVDRYRPEAYDQTKDFGERQSGNSKNAFFAGHVALVGTATFFAASIYDEYHPDRKLKWLFYGIATAATGTTIYLRHQAGKHFPSDLLVGTVVGLGSGMLVPRLHRNKAARAHSWNISPSIGQGYGLAATWRF